MRCLRSVSLAAPLGVLLQISRDGFDLAGASIDRRQGRAHPRCAEISWLQGDAHHGAHLGHRARSLPAYLPGRRERVAWAAAMQERLAISTAVAGAAIVVGRRMSLSRIGEDSRRVVATR